MKSKIGLISSQTRSAPVYQFVQTTDLDCEMDVLEYGQMSDLPRVYQENRDRYDGFCITGGVAKELVLRSRGKDNKPLYSISGHASECYRVLFHLMEENRAVDLSRIMLDSYLWLGGTLRTAKDFVQHHQQIEKKQEEVIRALPDFPQARYSAFARLPSCWGEAS